MEAHNKTLKKSKLNRKRGNKREIARDFVLLKKHIIILTYHNTNKKKKLDIEKTTYLIVVIDYLFQNKYYMLLY